MAVKAAPRASSELWHNDTVIQAKGLSHIYYTSSIAVSPLGLIKEEHTAKRCCAD